MGDAVDARGNALDLYGAVRSTSLKERSQGPSAPLKRFHNAVKRSLINSFAHGAYALLDLACGRGGDVRKWIDASVGTVTAVDLCPVSIEEAKRRALGLQHTTEYDFQVCTTLGSHVERFGDGFTCVTCMFALHYFFETEAMARSLLETVSVNLHEGGYFCGVVADGARVQSVLGTTRVFSNAMLDLQALWNEEPKDPKEFGSAYRCTIADTVTDGQGSVEYLVFENTLVSLAREYNLRPVTFYELDSCGGGDGPLFKQLHAKYDNADLSVATSLFAAFAFQKIIKYV